MSRDLSRREANGLERAPLALAVAGKCLEAVSLVGLAVLVPRALGPADFGQFALALSFVSIGATATALGGPALTARFLPPLRASERAAAARALALRLGRLRLAWAAAICALGGALAALDPVGFPPEQVALACLALVLSVLATLLLQIGLGLGRVGAWVARYPLENAVIAGGALALYPSLGIVGPVLALPLGTAAALLLGAASSGRDLLRGSSRAQPPPGALAFGRVQMASGALSQLVYRGGVPLAALFAASAAETGEAALALGIAAAGTLAVVQLFVVTLPRSSVLAERDPEAAEGPPRRLALLTLLAAIPVCVAGALLAEPLAVGLFGEVYRGAGSPLALAFPLIALAPLTAYAAQLAAIRLRPGVVLAGWGLGLLTFVGAALALIPATGATGAVAASLAGVAVATSAQLWSLRPRGASAAGERGRPAVSVIVPTRDRPAALRRCLRALAAQTQELEVIVVDDGSLAAGEVATIAREAGARLIESGGRGPAAARNAGAAAARGEVICFTDDDCEPTPGWAAALAARARWEPGVAAGQTVNAAPGNPFAAASQEIANQLMRSSLDPETGRVGFAPSCNLAVRADRMAQLRFDEGFPLAAGEDRDWTARALRAGLAPVLVPEARVLHHQRRTLSAFCRQHLSYGRGAIHFRRGGPELERRSMPLGFYAEVLRGGIRAGPAAGAATALAQAVTALGAALEGRRTPRTQARPRLGPARTRARSSAG